MLTIDFANTLSDRVGSHGLDPALLAPNSNAARAIAAHTKKLASTRGTGWERWRDLANEPMRSEHLKAVKAIANERRNRFDNLVVLGIGGSALGNIALQSALNPPTWNLLPSRASGMGGTGVPPVLHRTGPRLFVIDNVDPAYFQSTIDFCASQPGGLKSTLFNVISKSGETAETAAQFMILRDLLAKSLGPTAAANIVAITDPAKGTMRRICEREGYVTLPVPDGVGGRFSVLSPVGLFSAAMCGIDIDALLDGAAAMDRRCSSENLLQNPAALLATILVELGTSNGKTNHVLMPYHNSLYLLADWYRQIWAESLGKQKDLQGNTVYAGFTPIKALGTTDQHSQVQLYREGPNDKVLGLVEVAPTPSASSSGMGGTGMGGTGVPPVHHTGDVQIPTGLGVEALQYLEGKTLGQLLHAEKRATEYALVESQRPNYTITFPTLNAYHVGEFIQLWQIATAYAGLLLNVDAYDQPAVELGKQATFGLMGRAGYEKFLTQVSATLTPTNWVV
ncbi:glucose-6-phosphate isomerase [Phycisphaerales bacterium]|nr:glucose-6-phosphate isomerase [Phycisphaerales bacterium]